MGFWSVIADDRFEGTKGKVSFVVDSLYRYLLLLFIIYLLLLFISYLLLLLFIIMGPYYY